MCIERILQDVSVPHLGPKSTCFPAQNYDFYLPETEFWDNSIQKYRQNSSHSYFRELIEFNVADNHDYYSPTQAQTDEFITYALNNDPAFNNLIYYIPTLFRMRPRSMAFSILQGIAKTIRRIHPTPAPARPMPTAILNLIAQFSQQQIAAPTLPIDDIDDFPIDQRLGDATDAIPSEPTNEECSTINISIDESKEEDEAIVNQVCGKEELVSDNSCATESVCSFQATADVRNDLNGNKQETKARNSDALKKSIVESATTRNFQSEPNYLLGSPSDSEAFYRCKRVDDRKHKNPVGSNTKIGIHRRYGTSFKYKRKAYYHNHPGKPAEFIACFDEPRNRNCTTPNPRTDKDVVRYKSAEGKSSLLDNT